MPADPTPAALLPPDPEVSGWHFLRRHIGLEPEFCCRHWSAQIRRWDDWFSPAGVRSSGWSYYAPADPDDAATIRALREEVAGLRAALMRRSPSEAGRVALAQFTGAVEELRRAFAEHKESGA